MAKRNRKDKVTTPFVLTTDGEKLVRVDWLGIHPLVLTWEGMGITTFKDDPKVIYSPLEDVIAFCAREIRDRTNVEFYTVVMAKCREFEKAKE